MSPFDKLFQAQVDKLLSANDKRRAFFFRGFLPKQIEFLIKHKTSLYMNEDFIEDDCLQIQKIEANKRALVKQLTLAEDSVVGFYEELVAISSAVKDVSLVFDGEIVIIDNPLFESNVPSPLSLEQAVALFEYMQTDGKAENDTLEVLNRYYHEVNFLDADHVLVALANVHEDAHYLRLPLFDNKDLTEMAMINQPADEILEGSSEDWLYRFSVMSGAANEIVYVVDSVCPHNLEKGLFTVLAALSIPHSIRRVDTRIPEMEYDDSQFEKYLRRYWGPQAKFRELKFYKQPSVSKEITIISQGALVSEIIDQCEAARDEDCTYRDIFITAPTGAGKSLLFQLPALYMAEKYGLITIVVTPLVALMHDQVAQLERERGVKNATFLNSKITFEERQQRIQEIHDGKKSIIYLAPELLLASGLQPIVGERSVGLLVIDEVHTVTSWGRDFRPDYCFLGDFLKTIKRTGQRFPLLCLTATAVYSGPDDVVNDTIAELDLHNPILHLGNVKRDNINVCWPMYAAMPAVLKAAMENAYRSAGWNLVKSENKHGDIFPNFVDVALEVEKYINKSEYSDENKSNYKGSLLTRLESLTNGINSLIFTADDIEDNALFEQNVIVDLSRVGSMETKALIMGVLILKLQEHRIACTDKSNSNLRHVTVLEEAHNLLKRTSTEQSSETANLLGKSVEMLANSIAEMRTYGEGFIIADQSPGLLDMSVIRNTNTKIIMRLPDFSDRELVGKAAGLNDDQIIELAKLPRGVAAVYQNDWISPVLCSVEKPKKLKEEEYIEKTNYPVPKDDTLLFDLLDSGFRAKLDDLSQEEAFKKAILKSSVPTETKLRLMDYLSTKKSAESVKLLASMVFDHFKNAKAVLESTTDEASVEDLKTAIMAELDPSIMQFEDEQINILITLIIKEYTDRYYVDYPLWREFAIRMARGEII